MINIRTFKVVLEDQAFEVSWGDLPWTSPGLGGGDHVEWGVAAHLAA